MIKSRQITATMTELFTEDGFIHRIGTDSYFKRGCIKTADIEQFEWVAEQPPHTKDEYNAEVERLIAERYTTGQEIQFAREQNAAGDKYADYLAFIAQCKETAKTNLLNRAIENHDNPN